MDANFKLVDDTEGVKKTIEVDKMELGECMICKVKTTKKCRDCSIIPGTSVPFYCGKEHQAEHWPTHQPHCIRTIEKSNKKIWKNSKDPKRPIDELVKCVVDDYLPAVGSMSYNTFGFSKCKTESEESYLLGVYVGLIKMLTVDLNLVEEAAKNGGLADLIRNTFETQRPEEDSRGQYYPWFLENQHIVGKSEG